MTQHASGLHHFRHSRRLGRKTRAQKLLDKLIYPIIFIGPLMALPQLAMVWVERNASGVSPVTWGAFVIVNCFWLAYGVAHKERPIILSACAWMIVNVLVAVGAVVHGGS